MPKSQIADYDAALWNYRLTWATNSSSLVQEMLLDPSTGSLATRSILDFETSKLTRVRAKPYLGTAIFRSELNQRHVDYQCKGVCRMSEVRIGMNRLSFWVAARQRWHGRVARAESPLWLGTKDTCRYLCSKRV